MVPGPEKKLYPDCLESIVSQNASIAGISKQFGCKSTPTIGICSDSEIFNNMHLNRLDDININCGKYKLSKLVNW